MIQIRRLRTTASPQEQEKAILSAAAEEFARVGVRRSNLATIAEQAGVSRTTLYRRFPTKEELLYAVVRDATEAILADLAQRSVGLTLSEAVAEVFCVAVQETENNPVLRRLTIAEPDTMGALLGFVGPGMDAVLERVVALAVQQA